MESIKLTQSILSEKRGKICKTLKIVNYLVVDKLDSYFEVTSGTFMEETLDLKTQSFSNARELYDSI